LEEINQLNQDLAGENEFYRNGNANNHVDISRTTRYIADSIADGIADSIDNSTIVDAPPRAATMIVLPQLAVTIVREAALQAQTARLDEDFEQATTSDEIRAVLFKIWSICDECQFLPEACECKTPDGDVVVAAQTPVIVNAHLPAVVAVNAHLPAVVAVNARPTREELRVLRLQAIESRNTLCHGCEHIIAHCECKQAGGGEGPINVAVVEVPIIPNPLPAAHRCILCLEDIVHPEYPCITPCMHGPICTACKVRIQPIDDDEVPCPQCRIPTKRENIRRFYF